MNPEKSRATKARPLKPRLSTSDDITPLTTLLFSVHGRVPRRVYWATTILSPFVLFVTIGILPSIAGGQEDAMRIAILLAFLLTIWSTLAIRIKRWHDHNKSGWWILIRLIPFVGSLWAFMVEGCFRGTHGPNEYGSDET